MNENREHPISLVNGFYRVRIENDWFIALYSARENLFFLPGYFEGFDPKEFKEIGTTLLDKKVEAPKRRDFSQNKSKDLLRKDGYYWVMHDYTWFAAYYESSQNEFLFPGQTMGFDPWELEEIDEAGIEIG